MTIILSRFRSLLAVGMFVIATVSWRGTVLGNIGYLWASRALGETHSRQELEYTTRWLGRIPPDARSARTHFRIGQAYGLLGNDAQAADALMNAVEAGCQEVECHLGLVDVLIRQGDVQAAAERLLALLEFAPLESRAHERLKSLLDGPLAPAFLLDNHQVSTWPIYVDPASGSALSVELPDSHPRWLSISCSGEADASLRVCSPEIHSTPTIVRCDSPKRVLITASEARVVQVHLNGTGPSPIRVDAIKLEYVTNAEQFAEIRDSSWTQAPHKAIAASGSYETCLFLDTDHPRWLTVAFYDYPERDLQVFAEGKELGSVHGGMRTRERIGGFTPFSFALPPETPPLVRVTLGNPNPLYATATTSMCVTRFPAGIQVSQRSLTRATAP